MTSDPDNPGTLFLAYLNVMPCADTVWQAGATDEQVADREMRADAIAERLRARAEETGT